MTNSLPQATLLLLAEKMEAGLRVDDVLRETLPAGLMPQKWLDGSDFSWDGVGELWGLGPEASDALVQGCLDGTLTVGLRAAAALSA